MNDRVKKMAENGSGVMVMSRKEAGEAYKAFKRVKAYDQHKMKRTQIRQDQLQAGFFDGRFVSRTETPKNVYSRKSKHKKDWN